jgi:hypothetical protein
MDTQAGSLESFVEKLLEEKQFQNLEPEVHAQLKKDLIGRAEDCINTAILEELSESDLKEFETMVDQGAPAPELQAYLTAHVNDMEQVVAGTLLRFRNSYVGAAQ